MGSNSLTLEVLKTHLVYEPGTGFFERISGRHAGKPVGSIDSSGHMQVYVAGKLYLAHRLAWFYVYGVWPEYDLDHRDRNPTNNSIRNLRECTRQQNCLNKGPCSRNTTGFKGVHWAEHAKSFRSRITVKGKRHDLGCFRSAEEAHKAYVEAAKALHKEFAYTH